MIRTDFGTTCFNKIFIKITTNQFNPCFSPLWFDIRKDVKGNFWRFVRSFILTRRIVTTKHTTVVSIPRSTWSSMCCSCTKIANTNGGIWKTTVVTSLMKKATTVEPLLKDSLNQGILQWSKQVQPSTFLPFTEEKLLYFKQTNLVPLLRGSTAATAPM